MSRAVRACVVDASVAGRLGSGLRVQVAGRAPRLRDRRDGVLENELFLRARFQQHRELVETANAARQLGAVEQVDHDCGFLATNCVEKRVLYVLRCLFAVRHG